MKKKTKIEYPVRECDGSWKRICLTLDLKDDPELIAAYKRYHRAEYSWPEINEGIRKSGIKMMDIYCLDTRMFMICEVHSELDFDKAWNEMGSYPRQNEWAELMRKFIKAVPGHKLEWVKMERVFNLPVD